MAYDMQPSYEDRYIDPDELRKETKTVRLRDTTTNHVYDIEWDDLKVIMLDLKCKLCRVPTRNELLAETLRLQKGQLSTS